MNINYLIKTIMKGIIFKGGKGTGKSREARLRAERIGIVNTVFIDGSIYNTKNNLNSFRFSGITKETKLIIIDNCSIDFDYSEFYNTIDEGEEKVQE